jgi:hypothetical protein
VQRYLSLGAGVQSTTIAIMSARGDLPRVDRAIFADTGWEPAGVYEHLRRLTAYLDLAGIPVDVVSSGNIRVDMMTPGRFVGIPVYIKGKGQTRRQCTQEYKLRPVKDRVRELLGAKVTIQPDGRKKVGRLQWGVTCENWVGISVDEIERQRPSDVKYMQRVDPLLDIVQMTRADCVAYLEQHWPWPVAKSACIGCPFHDNASWREMRDRRPDEWADAVSFDRELRVTASKFEHREMLADGYLHYHRRPLDECNLEERAPGRPKQGCGPYDCRSE